MQLGEVSELLSMAGVQFELLRYVQQQQHAVRQPQQHIGWRYGQQQQQ